MPTPETWKTLAWNGVSLRVPREWRPEELRAFALLAAGQDGPSLELAWDRVGGRFDVQHQLGRVTRSLGPDAALDASPQALSHDWSDPGQALGEHGITATPYAWRDGNGTGGAGAILYNPASGIAATAHFTFRDPYDPQDAVMARAILESYRDHPPQATVPWAAFGIRAEIPGSMELRSFSFHPGHFRIIFSSGKGPHAVELVLDRLGPADAMLGHRTLAQYADVFYGALGAPQGFFEEDGDNHDTTRGALDAPAPLLGRLLGRPCLSNRRGRMWREGIGAMLLGAFMRAGRTQDLSAFDALCDAYAMTRA